jgi:hypothetical protein
MANLAIWRRKIRAEVVSTTHNNADQIKFEASLSELCLKFIRKWFLLLGSHSKFTKGVINFQTNRSDELGGKI